MAIYIALLLLMEGVSLAQGSSMPVLKFSMEAPKKIVAQGTEFTITCSLLAANPSDNKSKGNDVRVRRMMLVKQSLDSDNVWRRTPLAACYGKCGLTWSAGVVSTCLATSSTRRDYASLSPGVDRGSETVMKTRVSQDVTTLTSNTLRVTFPRSGCQHEASYACLAEVRHRGQVRTLAGRHLMETVLMSSDHWCPEPCVTFENSCYTIFLAQLTWDRAEAKCVQNKGHLATISSPANNKFLVKLLGRNTKQQFFIGLNDRSLEGRFSWASLAPSNFRYWDVGQPSSNKDEADCVVVSPINDTWQTAECTTARPFICERSLDTEPLASQQGCTASSLEYMNMCYQFINQSLTYSEASRYCHKMGSQLVEFESLSHYNYIRQWLNSYKANVYIGLRDRTGRNVYNRWDSGKPEVVGDWMAKDEDAKREPCVQLFRASDAYHFRDVSCTQRLQFVCQRPLLYPD